MKKFVRACLVYAAAALIGGVPVVVLGQGTVFTYQGRLSDGGLSANGTNYGMVFYLYDAPTNGNLLGNQELLSVLVTNGLFTASLDFGSVFNGSPRWLEIAVRKNGGGFTTLTPRQPITPAAYAMTAGNASNLLGTLPAGQLSGVIALTNLPSAVVTNNESGVNISGTFSGSGAGLTGVPESGVSNLVADLALWTQQPVPIIPKGATYTNFDGPAYQLNLVPGQTYLAIVTNATGSIQDDTYTIDEGGVFLFVAPAGSQLGGNDPLFAVGGTGTTVDGLVQEQVYSMTSSFTPGIVVSNLAVLQSFIPLGNVIGSIVSAFSSSNQVAIGSSPTNGIDFLNGQGINFNIQGSPYLRITNSAAGPFMFIDPAVGLGWAINGGYLPASINWNANHDGAGRGEYMISSSGSMALGAGINFLGNGALQMGSANSTHEIIYRPPDGFPGHSDNTGEGWSSTLIPSKSDGYQYGWFTNSTALNGMFTLRSEPVDIAGNAQFTIWDSTQKLRSTNSSIPGFKTLTVGRLNGSYYAFVNGPLIAGTTNVPYTTLESAGTFGLRNWTTNSSFTLTTNLAISTLFLNETNLTITLPDCTLCSNRVYTFKQLANSAAALATTSGQHIDGTSTAPEYTIPAQYGAVTVQSDGVQWWVLSKF